MSSIELELLQKELAVLRFEQEDKVLNPHKYYDLYPWQHDFIYQETHIEKYGRYPHRLYLTCANQVGKANCVEEQIPTPSGIRRFGDLKPGDIVFGQDGQETKVTHIFPQGIRECVKVTMSDGSSTIVDYDHLWITKGSKERFKPLKRNGEPREEYGQWVVKSTKEIIADGKYNPTTNARLRHVIPIAKPVMYTEKDLFNPYLVGVLLGDGCLSQHSANVVIANPDKEIRDEIASKHSVELLPNNGCGFRVYDIGKHVENLGLSGHRSYEKFIPKQYLTGSIEQRMELLRGLMDTDGYVSREGSMSYCTTSKKLAEDVNELVCSLGGYTRTKTKIPTYTLNGEKKEGRLAYNVYVYINECPFKLSRKANRFRIQDRYKHERVIVSIEPVGKREAMCIRVDNDDSSYLVTRNHIVTHNTLGLMLLAHRLCTDVEFRDKQWPNGDARVIWYVLPTQDHINDFYDEKWVPDILSSGAAKNDGPHSWKVIKKGRDIKGIHFLATNCKLMFITMAAKGSSMQGRSVAAILFDEEVDPSKLGELETRTNSFNDPDTGLSNAILAFAFTPTSAYPYFRNVFSFQDEEFLENIPLDIRTKFFWDKQTESFRTVTVQQEANEIFPKSSTVYKRRVSLFEAQRFRSGKQGRYTVERILEIIDGQVSKKDLMVRVFAAFEREDNGGLIYKYFNRDIHTKWFGAYHRKIIGGSGIITAGLDYGSGSNHPGGVCLTWISPDFKQARVFKMWRGEKGLPTTAGDIVDKYIEMSDGFNVDFPFYDHSAADLKTEYNRKTGLELLPAVKDKEGYAIVDTLFKANILQLYGYGNDPYLDWAIQEFESIDHGTPKKYRLDELSDTIRYSLAGVAHLFNLQDIVPVNRQALLETKIEETKTPEDYGVRSWANVPSKEQEDEWRTNDIDEWASEFEF